MTIHEIKKEPIKSKQEIHNVLVDALNFSREEECVSISVTVVSKNHTYNSWAVHKDGNFGELVGNLDRIKRRICEQWDK